MILTIPLPDKEKMLIKVGQHVDMSTDLYEKKMQREMKVYISQKIDVRPQKIFQYLKKLVGEAIREGELLAEKKSFMSGKGYKSEYTGVLKEVNHNDGSILIEVATESATMQKAYFVGDIVKIEKDSIHLKVNKMKEYETKEGKQSIGGKVMYLSQEREPIYEESIADHIVVMQALTGYNQVKLEALGAKGLVTLHKLNEETDLPNVLFKQIKEFEEAMKDKLPYCFIDGIRSKIIFYS